MKKISCLLPFLLSACAGIQATPYTTHSGNAGYQLTCSEFNTTLDTCKAKASELCGNGYDVDKSLSYRETFPDSGDGIYMPARQHLAVICHSNPK